MNPNSIVQHRLGDVVMTLLEISMMLADKENALTIRMMAERLRDISKEITVDHPTSEW